VNLSPWDVDVPPVHAKDFSHPAPGLLAEDENRVASEF
jgi:hypothetical protein